MDFFFQDTDEIRLPPEEVRLRGVQVMPLPDGKRVKVVLELTPFKKRPNVEVTITTASGKKVSHTSILETMLHKIDFIMQRTATIEPTVRHLAASEMEGRSRGSLGNSRARAYIVSRLRDAGLTPLFDGALEQPTFVAQTEGRPMP